MALASPPLRDPIAVIGDRLEAQKSRLPKLVIGWEWIRWFSDLSTSVDKAPARQARVSLSNQSASIPLTPLPLTSVKSGLWRVSYWMKVVTPAGTSSSLQFTLTWTRNTIVLTSTAAAITGNTTGTYQFGTLVIRVDENTPISFSTVYASNAAAAMKHEIDVCAEQLALDEAA